jgi:hypothetical protein
MKKITLTTLAAVLALASAPAFADQPTGSYVFKSNNGADTQALSAGTIDNKVGAASAQIIQNGQFVSGQAQAYPGSRADIVQGLLGH